MRLLDRISECISSFWSIATKKNLFYEFVIEDIELRERDGRVCTLIYYRAIGSRTVHYASANELNESAVFSKFMPVQAQAIVTLETIESMMSLDINSLLEKYKEYTKKCATLFRSRRGK